MSTELPRYEYRLGFRYAANVHSVENSGRDHRTRGKAAALERIQRLQRDSFAATSHHRPTKPDEAGVEVATVKMTTVAAIILCTYRRPTTTSEGFRLAVLVRKGNFFSDENNDPLRV